MKLLLILLAVLLAGCKDDPTPPPVDPVEAEVIVISAPIEEIEPTPTETCDSYGLQAWVQYPVNQWDVQEVGLAVDYCDAPVQGQLVTVCVASVCHEAMTGQDGQAYREFSKTWDIGSVPVSVCLQDVPVCSSFSFTAEKGE
jgi:hypothetical protein